MQLLIQRGQGSSPFGRPIFHLWARFELTEEEQALIEKYRFRHFLLIEGNFYRDFMRSVRWALLIAFVALVASSLAVPLGPVFIISGICFLIATVVIYLQIKEEIRIYELLDGRIFFCRSLVKLALKERLITVLAVIFRHYLEAMKTWGGREIVDIEADALPTLRLLEPPYGSL